MDSITFPTAEEVRTALKPFTQKQLDRLALLSGVPRPTVAKIKYGQIQNPGLDTVAQFWPHLAAAQLTEPNHA